MVDKIYSLDTIAPNSLLHITHDSCYTETDYHSHNFFEIAYIDDGIYTHKINGKSYKAERGNVIFLKIGDKHSYKAETKSCNIINILFYPDLYADDFDTLLDHSNKIDINHIIQLNSTDIRQVETIIKYIYREQESYRDNSLDIMKRYLDILLLIITRSINVTETDTTQKLDITPLLNYISQNIKTLKPSDVAKKMSYNKSYFSKLFKEHVGITLVEYINNKRIDLAIRLIKETDESFETIATMVGFESTNYFYRIFKRYTGFTPSHYRKKNNNI